MAKVSVSVTGITTQNKDNSRTLGYVNPEATNAQLKQMAQRHIKAAKKSFVPTLTTPNLAQANKNQH